MKSRNDTLLNSLVDYVLDVKPYHTKLKVFLSELFFNDSFNVNITDKAFWTLYHQNVWTRDDVGGYQLQRLCEGIETDLVFRIPAAVWPRTSIDDNAGQTPPGDDPSDWLGIDSSSSHFTGSNFVPGERTKYRVPFHQGSRVYVDGVVQQHGLDYGVDDTRSFIEFAIAPGLSQHIEVQLFKVDRLFIAYNFPFDYANGNRNYDISGYDLVPYDGADTDSDYFELVIDSTRLNGYQSPIFYNSVPQRNKKAELTVLGINIADRNYDIGGYDLLSYDGADGDVWKITAVGPWKFKVQKNDTGHIWYANFKEPFDNGEISFVIDRVWSNYYLVPDNNSYDSFDILSFDTFNGSLDDTDFLVGLDLITEHGVVTDPIPPRHRPMEFIMKDVNVLGGFDQDGFEEYIFDEPSPSFTEGFSIGKVKKITQNLIPGQLDYYAFVLTEIPLRGTYVELRIEQNGQLNPWLNTTIKDDMYLQVSWPDGASIDVLDPFDIFDYDNHGYDENLEIIPAGTTRLIHNVNIGGQTIYEEPAIINELVLYHGRGGYPSNVLVENLGSVIPMITTILGQYFEGSVLPPDFIGIDKQRIVINLSTPQAIKVTLTF